MIPIVPAIIPTSLEYLRQTIPELRFSSELHLDVVDGEFVPYVSWPYQPAGDPRDIRDITDPFTLEVDLMVMKPLPAAQEWLAAGADMLVFHVETISSEDFKNFVETTKCTVSISANNDTSFETLAEYLPYADGVQLMGIAAIGAQGQGFDERVLERIVHTKNRFPQLPITIDGSVNGETIVRLVAARANRLICGSAVVKAEDPALAHFQLARKISDN